MESDLKWSPLLQQVGFSIEEDANAPAGKHARRVTKRTTQAIAMLLLPVSLLMVRSAARGLMMHQCQCTWRRAASRQGSSP